MSDIEEDDDQNEFRMQFTSENDFEGGEWIGGEFFYKSQNKGTTQTRDQQIYGIFEESDDDNNDNSRKKTAKSKRRKTGFSISGSESSTRSVQFVSKTINSNDLAETKVNLDEEEEEDLECQSKLEFSKMIGSIIDPKVGKSNADFRSMLLSIPNDESQDVSEVNIDSNDNKQEVCINKISETIKRNPVNPQALNHLGTWEKHTKGIGRKLLDKFGFSGRLGAHETGVSSAIEVKVRPGTIGLGFGDFKEGAGLATNKKVEAEWRGKEYIEETKENKKSKILVEKIAESKSWKKKGRSVSASKSAMLSVTQLMAKAQEGGDDNDQLIKQQVILDMRGEQTRIITDMSTISSVTLMSDTSSRVPKFGEELLYNINVISDLSDIKLKESASKLKQATNRLHLAEENITSLKSNLHRDMDRLTRLERIATVLERIHTKLNDPEAVQSLSMEAVAKAFETLSVSFEEEFKLFGLTTLLPSIITPVLESKLRSWMPLKDPKVIAEITYSWDPVLVSLTAIGEKHTATELLYETIENICLPLSLRSLTNEWDVKDPFAAVTLTESLKIVISSTSFEQLVSATILPKITAAVSSWTPTSDPIPIHTWIHPWLPLLGSRLSVVFPEIRRKLGHALTAWHPSDPSALLVIKPWVNVFDQNSMDQLLLRSIVPSLVKVMREFIIDPKAQDLTIFSWVLTWVDVIPRLHFISLLEGEFFPRWLQVLSSWLCSSPDFGEVTSWYLGWKGQFPETLLQDPTILSYFNHALEAMNYSLTCQIGSGVPLPPGIAENMSYYRVVERRNLETATARRLTEIQRPVNKAGGATSQVSFREVVEAYAESHGIAYLPKEGRTHEGKQIWQFGKKLIYIDMNVVFVYHSSVTTNGNANAIGEVHGSWNPMALEDLLAIS